MAAHDLEDAVGDTTSTTGTSDFVIDGVALTGCVTFASALTDGQSYGYRCETRGKSQWEVGSGIWTGATHTLSRVTVSRSSNGGAKVSFPAGPKSIGIVVQAQDFVPNVAAVLFDSPQTLSGPQQATARANIGFDAAAGAAAVAAPLTGLSTASAADVVAADTGLSAFGKLQAKFTQFATSVGASIVGFIQAGVGAIRRSIEDKLREYVSVKDYGAVGDGVTDDAAAIQRAVTYALTQPGAGVRFPAGTYLVNSTVSILGGVFIKSHGAYVVNGQTNAAAIQFGDGITRYYGGGISGTLFFTGKAGVVGVAGQKGLYVTKMGQMTFRGMRSNLLGSALYEPFYFSDVGQFYLDDIEAQSALNDGVTLLGCTDGRIVGGRSDANTRHGWALNGSAGCIFMGCSGYGNGGSAWVLQSTLPATAPNKWNWFKACFGDTSGSYNWTILDCKESIFLGCWGSTQIDSAVNTGANGFYIGTSYCDGLTFVGGLAISNNADGVYVDATTSSPTGLSFTDFTFGTSAAGNGRNGTAGYGLNISAGFTGTLRVKGGSFAGNFSGAYNNASPTADVIITGNPAGLRNVGRVPGVQGTAVASANNLVLSKDGTYYQVTGNTQINLISNLGWSGGDEVVLKFNGTPTVKHGVTGSGSNAGILLAGGVDYVAVAGDVLSLRYDGADGAWYETHVSGARLTLTGNVTGSGAGSIATTIANAAVTYAKMQNVSATSRILGRITAGAGSPEELTAANVKTILALTASDVSLGSVTNDAQTKAAVVPNTAPSAGQMLVGNAGGTAYAPVSASGAVTLGSAGAFTLATPGTLAVASTNSTATAHTHAITSSSAPGAAASLLATDASGIIGSTGARIVKIWAIDLTVTNSIAASVTGSAASWATARNLAGNSVDGSANVAFANKFVVQGTADTGLSAAQFLGALGTGIVKNTTTTGVLSIAVAGDFPTLNQNSAGSAASLSVSGQTGLMTVTGLLSTSRIKTVRDAADTLLELGGSYTPTGTWTSMILATPSIGAATGTSLAVSGALTSSSPSVGIGYAAGAGVGPTQLSSKSTGVSVTGMCGEITMNAAALGAGATVSFTLTNPSLAIKDVLIVNIVETFASSNYELWAGVGAGSAVINLKNISAGSLSQALVFNFLILKGQNS